MKKLKLIIILCTICLTAAAQKNKKKSIQPPSISEGEILEQRMDCIFRKNYTTSERLMFFPFNKYKKIVLISFEWPEPKDEIIESDAANIAHQIYNASLLDDKTKRQEFYKSITKESKLLSPAQINQLTNLLYNYGVKSDKSYHGILGVETKYSCYNPRNAILFLDNKGQLMEYIDFCFECHERRISSEKIHLNKFCNQKYDLIKKFFKSVGINYGTEFSKLLE